MKWLFLITLGCTTAPNGLPPTAGEDTASPMGSGLVFIGGASLPLGETNTTLIDEYDGDDEETQTIIPMSSHTIDDFYMDRYPFPGVEGEDWFSDGTRHNTIEALDATLVDFGRRVCSIAELMYAAAGPGNHRLPYGDGSTWGESCDPDDENPSPLGSFPNCESDFGIRDFQVRSTWGRLDAQTISVMQGTPQADGFPGDLSYAVWGGTSRDDTFYAPSNFGFHTHGRLAEDLYLDDGFRVCADDTPTTNQEIAYARWMDRALDAGSYEALFD
jgi:hypothetical protein